MNPLSLTEQDSVFLARVVDSANLCRTRSIPKYIGFIDERQAVLAAHKLDSIGFSNYCFRGGYDDAKRVFLCILPDYMSREEHDEYPVFCCYFRFRDCDELSHRDFLGSLMALGIKRETIGDILVKKGEAVVFTTETVSQMILSDISKVGRIGVRVSCEFVDPFPFVQEFDLIEGTISSLRLDCITAFVTNLSREKSATLISAKNVSINHFECTDLSKNISSNDIISIRGYGRFVLDEIGPTTRKGRIRITIKKYK